MHKRLMPREVKQLCFVDAQHPLLQALFDSFCVIDGSVCWSHHAMFNLRDALTLSDLKPPVDNSACKFASGGACCVSWCGDKVCLKAAT